MLLALAALATAGPLRCVASWSGPVEGCALWGDLQAEASGANERAATRAARRQLEMVAQRSVRAYASRFPQYDQQEFERCAALVRDRSFVNCFPDPALAAADALCFVELDDTACWGGQVLTVEGPGWEVLARGRAQMCEAVDAWLVSKSFSDREVMRAWCAASCLARTTVRCPSAR